MQEEKPLLESTQEETAETSKPKETSTSESGELEESENVLDKYQNQQLTVDQLYAEEWALKVMVGVDGSKTSDAALEKALDIVKHAGDNPEKNLLLVLSVSEHVSAFAGGAAIHVIVEENRINDKRTIEILSKYGKKIREEKVHYLLIKATGSPREAITREVDKWTPDLLVLGRRGMSKLSRLIMGSTTSYCSSHVDCPLYVVKEHPEDKDH
eukprot:CAMPEP_0174250720 /NCGR_PEP_ID=MMETSP0439-20130205/804_1 /TAXON_ID=0 /ORGANISM="Stereomyxa ramosa, Strain Chinc5" /LENGTH=211 /DNA_ID=CAMNT_0015330861 /DNA_START=12 /DNA_END=647 /DNA_ORIENTATION=+